MRRYGTVWVVVPVFNEAQVITEVLAEVTDVFPNAVCVDDGSGDDSAERISGTTAHLVRHPVNLGQGASLQTGIAYALGHGAEYLVTFDADGQHRVEDARTMVDAAMTGDVDVVLGSRFLRNPREVPRSKRAVLRAVTLLSPTSRRLRLTDAHNGLRVLNRRASLGLSITMDGMAHASEIVGYLAGSGLRIKEMPVTVRYTDYSRAKGQSLMNGVNIVFDLSVRNRGR